MSQQEISPAVLERAKKLMAKDEEKAAKRQENLSKYPHAQADTLQFDSASNKYSVEITCTECGTEGRRVFTSDLFQVTTCESCAKTAKAAKKAAKKKEIEEAKAYLAAQKANG
jgi:hypothetical protein